MIISNLKTQKHSWYANAVNHTIRILKFLVLSALALGIYEYLLSDIITGKSHILAFVALWLFTGYVVLPSVYRWISKLFLPDYFIGRTRTSDGLLGDPVNIVTYGTKEILIKDMEKAGWTMAEPLSLKSSLKMIYAAVFKADYPNAPVSSLFLFNRRQTFAFEQDVDNNPRKRHHIRFWDTPVGWWLPGGYQVDWLGAATFDENVSLSLFTGQITHKIDSNVDQERDHVLQTLKDAKVTTDIKIVEHFTTGYHGRNGEGDSIHTDGALPFITLKR